MYAVIIMSVGFGLAVLHAILNVVFVSYLDEDEKARLGNPSPFHFVGTGWMSDSQYTTFFFSGDPNLLKSRIQQKILYALHVLIPFLIVLMPAG